MLNNTPTVPYFPNKQYKITLQGDENNNGSTFVPVFPDIAYPLFPVELFQNPNDSEALKDRIEQIPSLALSLQCGLSTELHKCIHACRRSECPANENDKLEPEEIRSAARTCLNVIEARGFPIAEGR